MAKPKKNNPSGRPTGFTPELGLEICARMAEGESVRSICLDDNMPCRKTINNWLLKPDHKEFLRQYETAENLRADNLFDEILDIANDSSNDYITRETKSGDFVQIANRENIQRARLKIGVRKWALSKMLP